MPTARRAVSAPGSLPPQRPAVYGQTGGRGRPLSPTSRRRRAARPWRSARPRPPPAAGGGDRRARGAGRGGEEEDAPGRPRLAERLERAAEARDVERVVAHGA